MRVLFHSNAPWVGSGYGQSVRWFAHALQKMGHDAACSSYHGLQGTLIEWEGIEVFPMGNERWAMDVATAHAKVWKADVIVPVVDAWILRDLVAHAKRASLPIVLWSPIDQDPTPWEVVEVAREADLFAVYSRYGLEHAERSGLTNARYVPLGIDTEVFAPMDKAEARKLTGLPTDHWIAGMVSANKCPHNRKALAQQIEGFALFHRRHPESRLYMHCDPKPGKEGTGWHLDPILRELGLKDAVIFASPYRLIVGYPVEHMRALYASFDVLLQASAGEGFGVPILEAEACNIPAIIGDWTSMPELSGSRFVISRSRAMRWRTPYGGHWYYPEPEAVAEALHHAYRASPPTGLRERVERLYSAERVAKDHLLPVLEEALG